MIPVFYWLNILKLKYIDKGYVLGNAFAHTLVTVVGVPVRLLNDSFYPFGISKPVAYLVLYFLDYMLYILYVIY
jgi:hypothetical protein